VTCKAQKKQEIRQSKYAKNRFCKEWRKEDEWRLKHYREWMKK